jgi:hypothetical protein
MRIAKEVSRRLLGVSPLGDYNGPLTMIIGLTAIKPIARAYVKSQWWTPPVDHGRRLQVRAYLHQQCPLVCKSATIQARA